MYDMTYRQSGFRAGHSTALLKATEDTQVRMENKLITILVLIDYSNAFHMVDHDTVLANLIPKVFIIDYGLVLFISSRSPASRLN
ncbi:unnamed protein product [Euphydryas editha]|uniref:Reverse transcriptase domain-containing protein n=1 Tax=Euphydryas editha TaxID=104508 RepID=A0AAU9TYV0_EUPED|nr:unnamed protein product [Euphydryas editha]